MKIKNRSNEVLTIEDAIQGSLKNTHGDGQLERTREQLGNVTNLLSKLIEMLYDNKVLNKEQVSEFLNWQFTVED